MTLAKLRTVLCQREDVLTTQYCSKECNREFRKVINKKKEIAHLWGWKLGKHKLPKADLNKATSVCMHLPSGRLSLPLVRDHRYSWQRAHFTRAGNLGTNASPSEPSDAQNFTTCQCGHGRQLPDTSVQPRPPTCKAFTEEFWGKQLLVPIFFRMQSLSWPYVCLESWEG